MPNVTNQQIRFFPHDTFAELWARRWPTEFEVEWQPLDNKCTVPDPIRLSGELTYTLELFSGSFILFYDGIESEIRAKYSDNSSTWPSELTMGRIIRNAFAHGNTFEIRNPSVPKTVWRGLAVDASNNGQRVLFGALGIADAIILMEDIDKLL